MASDDYTDIQVKSASWFDFTVTNAIFILRVLDCLQTYLLFTESQGKYHRLVFAKHFLFLVDYFSQYEHNLDLSLMRSAPLRPTIFTFSRQRGPNWQNTWQTTPKTIYSTAQLYLHFVTARWTHWWLIWFFITGFAVSTLGTFLLFGQ